MLDLQRPVARSDPLVLVDWSHSVPYQMMEDRKMGALCLSWVCRYAEVIGEPFLQRCGTSGAPLVLHEEVEAELDDLDAEPVDIEHILDVGNTELLRSADAASLDDETEEAVSVCITVQVAQLTVEPWSVREQIVLRPDCDT